MRGLRTGWRLRMRAFKTGAKKARLRVRIRRYADASSDGAPEDVEDAARADEPPPHQFNLNEPAPDDVANDPLASPEDEAPFDPPNADDILGLEEEFEDEFIEAEAPFDAPDDIEESFGVAPVASPRDLPVIDLIPPLNPPKTTSGLEIKSEAMRAAEQATPHAMPPLPPITVLATWDRAESGEMLAAFAAHESVARAEIGVERGGLDGALAALEGGLRPDLVIVDTTLSGAEMVQGVDRLLARLSGAKLIVIGAVNDIGVLRALNQRGVSAYMMAPVAASDLVQAACAQFAHDDRSRVIAVLGARGGVGASSLAQNIAWTLAERCDTQTALVDLDIGFGAAASNFQLEPQSFVTDVMDRDVGHAAFDRALTQASDRLFVVASPAKPQLGLTLEPASVTAMLARVRRTSAFVVLDLPHVWTAWVKDVLVGADEVVLVAGPDLASLRNADNLTKLLREARGERNAPVLAITMTGVPKRPEIPLKDFAEALGVAPCAMLPFDPELYGAAEMNRSLLCTQAPTSKQAQTIEALACTLSGREIVERKTKRAAPKLPEPAPLVLEAKDAVASPTAIAEPALLAEPPQNATPAQLEDAKNPDDPAPMEAKVDTQAPPKPAKSPDRDGLSDRERAYVERARQRALGEVDARRISKRRRRTSRTMLRFTGVIAAAYALGLVTLWASREQTQAVAEAAPPPASPVALAAPADPFVSLEQDYTEAMALLARNDETGVALLRRAAEAGFPMAQYRLAKLYENGEFVDADLVAAREWTERAAGGGNVRAMHDLGFYFARGDGVAIDETAAFRWFRQAAEFGYADSQYNLGVLYQQGRGVSADMGEALFWFTLAAQNGDEAARERVAQLGAELSVVHLEQARARAEGFSPREPNAMANGAWAP